MPEIAAHAFWPGMREAVARWDVLRHPFYRRWSSGGLDRDQLALYAGQYRQLVIALAAASARVAAKAAPEWQPLLAAHAEEEEAHIDLWDGFLAAVGGDAHAEPLPETVHCARTWAGAPARSVGESLAVIWAIEAAAPAVSETKRLGLVERYGVRPGRGTAYFDVHAVRDAEHAELDAAVLEATFAGSPPPALHATAAAAMEANWRMLDGVDEACRHGAGALQPAT